MTGRRLLILGGTGEAAALARGALARFGERMQVATALAGGAERAGRLDGPIPGHVRIGGFRGAADLADYLAARRIDRLIDASHPFAPETSRQARVACETAGVPRLLLLRPPWRRHPLDRWVEVDSVEAAARVVARLGRRAWLTLGSASFAAFAPVTGVRFLVRLGEPPRDRLPLRLHEIVLGSGRFSLAEERHLLQRHAIDVLVCKASGGRSDETRLIAARELSLPVVLLRRPPAEPGTAVDTVEAALDWLAADSSRTPEAQRLP